MKIKGLRMGKAHQVIITAIHSRVCTEYEQGLVLQQPDDGASRTIKPLHQFEKPVSDRTQGKLAEYGDYRKTMCGQCHRKGGGERGAWK